MDGTIRVVTVPSILTEAVSIVISMRSAFVNHPIAIVVYPISKLVSAGVGAGVTVVAVPAALCHAITVVVGGSSPFVYVAIAVIVSTIG